MTEQPAKPSSAFVENFTLDIEPETRDEKSKGADEPLEQPKCKTCGDTGRISREINDGISLENCPDCPEQPSTNAMIVKTIQQRMHVITKELESLPDSPNRTMALDDIGIFEAGVLYKLQEEYE